MSKRPARTRTSPPARPSRVGALPALLMLGAAVVPVVVWLSRGIDLTDESYYLIGYAHPRDVFLTLSHFHYLVAALTGARLLPVAFYRALALVLALGAPAFFAFQLHRYARPAGAAPAGRRAGALVAFTALGGMLGYTVGPRTLSYNGLVNACVLVTAGLLFELLGSRASRAFHRLALAALLGLVLAALVPIKATSAALMGLWLLIAAAWLGLRAPGRWLELAAGGVLGAGLFAAAFFGRMISFHDWWSGISITREAMRALYSPAALAGSSLSPLLGQLTIAGAPALLSIVLVGSGARLATARPRGSGPVLLWLGVAVGVIAALLIRELPGSDRIGAHEGTRYAIVTALAMTLWLAGRARREGAAGAEARPAPTRLLVLLLVLPVVAAVGTNNPLSIQIQLYLAPWFAVLWLISDEMPAGAGRAAPEVIAAAAGVLAVWLVWVSQVVHPYRIPGGMSEQNLAFSSRIVAGRGLRVDVSTHDLVENTRDLLDRNGFRPGDPIFAFYDLPGLVYLVGGRAPRLPWIFSRSDPLACRAIALSRDEVARGRVFLLTRGGLSPALVDSLYAVGFRTDVNLLGTVKSALFGEVYVFAHAPPAAH